MSVFVCKLCCVMSKSFELLLMFVNLHASAPLLRMTNVRGTSGMIRQASGQVSDATLHGLPVWNHLVVGQPKMECLRLIACAHLALTPCVPSYATLQTNLVW